MAWKTHLETICTVTTTVVAVLLGITLIRGSLLPTPAALRQPPSGSDSNASVAVGTSLKTTLPDVDWQRNGRTLVLALSPSCHYCRESEPFYRKLQNELGRKVRIVAAFPQSVPEAEQYLSSAGLHVDQVKSVPLNVIGVRGTPTMLLVDAKGVVTKVWVGIIQEQQQQQILSLLKEV